MFLENIGAKMRGGIFSLLVLYMVSSREPIHGYAITKHIDEVSEGRIHIQAGTLYPVLRKLENHGLVHHQMVETQAGPPKKVYRPTPAGREAMVAGLGSLGDLVLGLQLTLGDDFPSLNVHR